jgi:hypothetical protein
VPALALVADEMVIVFPLPVNPLGPVQEYPAPVIAGTERIISFPAVTGELLVMTAAFLIRVQTLLLLLLVEGLFCVVGVGVSGEFFLQLMASRMKNASKKEELIFIRLF